MIRYNLKSLGLSAARGEEDAVARVWETPLEEADFFALQKTARAVGVTERLKDVLATFPQAAGTPAGFRRELVLAPDGVARVDLVRDIAYGENGVLRPTNVLFSADSANPYEVAPVSPLLANLTCNPALVYDQFINNEKANVGRRFQDRDEVMRELGGILGPGCDISVELNNPFEEDFSKLLEEAAKFREMFSAYRVVIKVPHTGIVAPGNLQKLLAGDGHLDEGYEEAKPEAAFRGHRLALKLHEAGYRINFTLMFEPYQALLALQAKPYFINTFLRNRLLQSAEIKRRLDAYDENGDWEEIAALRAAFVKNDYLPAKKADADLRDVLQLAKDLLRYRHFEDAEGADGLDAMRHNLRVLRNCNLPDTRLIVCSMAGEHNYPDIDKLLCEPEFCDMNRRVVITAPPDYLARFASTPQVTNYQRRFLKAAAGEK